MVEVSVGKEEVDVPGVSLSSDNVEPDDGVDELLVEVELSVIRRRAGLNFLDVESPASLQYFSHDSSTSLRDIDLRLSR
jgi:hypothetical protein